MQDITLFTRSSNFKADLALSIFFNSLIDYNYFPKITEAAGRSSTKGPVGELLQWRFLHRLQCNGAWTARWS